MAGDNPKEGDKKAITGNTAPGTSGNVLEWQKQERALGDGAGQRSGQEKGKKKEVTFVAPEGSQPLEQDVKPPSDVRTSHRDIANQHRLRAGMQDAWRLGEQASPRGEKSLDQRREDLAAMKGTLGSRRRSLREDEARLSERQKRYDDIRKRFDSIDEQEKKVMDAPSSSRAADDDERLHSKMFAIRQINEERDRLTAQWAEQSVLERNQDLKDALDKEKGELLRQQNNLEAKKAAWNKDNHEYRRQEKQFQAELIESQTIKLEELNRELKNLEGEKKSIQKYLAVKDNLDRQRTGLQEEGKHLGKKQEKYNDIKSRLDSISKRERDNASAIEEASRKPSRFSREALRMKFSRKSSSADYMSQEDVLKPFNEDLQRCREDRDKLTTEWEQWKGSESGSPGESRLERNQDLKSALGKEEEEIRELQGNLNAKWAAWDKDNQAYLRQEERLQTIEAQGLPTVRQQIAYTTLRRAQLSLSKHVREQPRLGPAGSTGESSGT